MKQLQRVLGLGAMFGLLTPLCFADTIFLKNGSELDGEILEETPTTVVFKERLSGAVRSIKRENVDLVVRDRQKTDDSSLFTFGTGLRNRKTQEEKKTAEEPGDKPPAEGEKTGEETAEGAKTGEETAEGAKTGAEADPEGKNTEGDAGTEGTGEKTAEGEPKDGETGAKKPAETEEKADPYAVPKEKKDAFDKAVKGLGSEKPSDREAAKAKLKSLGKDVIPGLAKLLQHSDAETRRTACDLLNDLNAKNAIKQLVETLYAVMPGSGQAASYQRQYVRSLKTALQTTTGQAFISVEPSSPLVQDGLKKYVEWYNANFDRLPPQIGEPEIEPTDPKYYEKLKEARALKLEKREWPRPPMSADIVTGEKPPAKPETYTRPEDKKYEEQFPVVKRDSADGIIREQDREKAKDFFRD
ncbi:MAG: hypothetical protein HS116_16980 [Planctomycetes bacterium]|nr:hypothetical protein [Planctomycetota bacterium]